MTNEKHNFDAVAEAKLLLRGTRAATLATVVSPSGDPFASLVNVATAMDGTPILLLSRLAAHTRHIDADSRLSLLFYSAINHPNGGDPLTHARLTITGRGERVAHESERLALRARFLARHPKSELYVDFADFGFFRVAIQTAHLNGGFGRAANLAAEQLLTPLTGASEFLTQEESILAELASSEPQLANRLAALHGRQGDQWRLVGFDPDGFDIGDEEEILRLTFAARVETADGLHRALASLLSAASR
ncbi:MAG: HugZ family protein [Methylovirgula sp.]